MAIALTACGSADEAAPAAGAVEAAPGAAVSQTVEIIATEYAFSGDPATAIDVGETVRFVVRNDGGLIHEMQVLDTDARLIDRTPELAPGEVGEVTVTFASPGVYQVICDVDDHLSRGQQATFTVGR